MKEHTNPNVKEQLSKLFLTVASELAKTINVYNIWAGIKDELEDVDHIPIRFEEDRNLKRAMRKKRMKISMFMSQKMAPSITPPEAALICRLRFRARLWKTPEQGGINHANTVEVQRVNWYI